MHFAIRNGTTYHFKLDVCFPICDMFRGRRFFPVHCFVCRKKYLWRFLHLCVPFHLQFVCVCVCVQIVRYVRRSFAVHISIGLPISISICASNFIRGHDIRTKVNRRRRPNRAIELNDKTKHRNTSTQNHIHKRSEQTIHPVAFESIFKCQINLNRNVLIRNSLIFGIVFYWKYTVTLTHPLVRSFVRSFSLIHTGYSIHGDTIHTSIEFIFSRWFCDCRTCTVHAIDGILHSDCVWFSRAPWKAPSKSKVDLVIYVHLDWIACH